MNELNQAELQRLEGVKKEIQHARASGLSDKISFINYYETSVDGQINALQSNGVSLETDDEKKKKNDVNNIAAVVVAQQHRMEIANFAENGFQSPEQFLDFSEKFKDKNFMATLDALPEEEKKKLADQMANQYNSMSVEDRKKTAPEAVNWVKEHSDIQLMSSNQSLEKIRNDVQRLGGDKAVAELGVAIAANNQYAEVIDSEAKAKQFTESKIVANYDQLLARTDLGVTVHNAAEEKGVANHQAEFVNNKAASLSNEEDMFADEPALASAAKQLQKAGVESDAGIVAPKPTEVEIVNNSIGKDSGPNLA